MIRETRRRGLAQPALHPFEPIEMPWPSILWSAGEGKIALSRFALIYIERPETFVPPCILTPMPRYYFHLRNDHVLNDDEGSELSGDEAAKERARRFALSMAAASIVEAQKLDLRHRIEVANEADEVIHTVAFGDVIEVKGSSASAAD